jgi:hypothetical protein
VIILIILGVPLALFVIPCLLPRPWLIAFSALALLGFLLLWRDHMAHQGEGNGVAEAFARFGLYVLTVSAAAGIGARALMLALRRKGLRWRYACLPAPLIPLLIIGAHYADYRHEQWQRRPPPDACLAAMHNVALGDVMLRIPTAPLFSLVVAGNMGGRLLLRWPPDHVREFCARTADGRVLDLARLRLDFVRDVPSDIAPWPVAFCAAVTDRPWLHRFCMEPVDLRAAHYPQEIEFKTIERMPKYDPTYAKLLDTLEGKERLPKYRRLRLGDGTWLALTCGDGGLRRCTAVLQPRPGLGVEFEFLVEGSAINAEAEAVAARVTEIAADLLRP